MSETINIYCDESCHLEHDEQKIMLVSCIYCPKEKVKQISEDIRALKQKHKIWRFAEIKWKKVSKSKRNFYFELLDYFINNKNLNFRTIIIDKSTLDHDSHKQDHNMWYYKMIYDLVIYIIPNITDNFYNVYTDKKENSNQAKIQLLKTKDCFSNCSHKKFNLNTLQNIESHQSEIMQLNDFLQGAVSFYNRGLYSLPCANITKIEIVEKIIKKLNTDLQNTNYQEKFNILKWEGKN